MYFTWLLLPLVACQQVFQSHSNLVDFTAQGESLLEFHKNLVEIPSVEPNELKVAEFLKDFLVKKGLNVEFQQAEDKRLNVYAYSGDSKDSKVLLTSHIDTVPPFFPYSIDGTKIYGRGSCDAKASVATQVFTYLSMLEDGGIKEGDVSLLYVVGEETTGIGMREASSAIAANWDVAIFGEPTEGKLAVGHKGILMCYVNVEGKASHSGYPELGISATNILIPVLNDLLNTQWGSDELLGPTTMNIGKINAGVANNVVPPFANASVFFRIAEDVETLKSHLEQKLSGIEHLSYEIPLYTTPQYVDFEVPGFDTIVVAYSTDIPNMNKQLSKKYLYGPGTIHVAHSAEEFIENQDLIDAIDGYRRLIKYNLG